MKSAIKKFDSDSEFFTNEQCYIIESWNTTDDSRVSIARARLQLGITTKAHYLCDVTERYLIIQGSARSHW